MEALVHQTELLQTTQSTERVMRSKLVMGPAQPNMFG